MEKKEKRKKTLTEELDEIIEMKKNEASAWKKIAESLTNQHEINNKKQGKK
ncbi:MAG TPA: hypothetical protein VIN10_15765 [Bacteroidales bacterium]